MASTIVDRSKRPPLEVQARQHVPPAVPGKVEIDDDEDFLPSGQSRCKAKAHSTQRRCKSPAIRGAAVCRVHGGNSPGVRRKAQLRLATLVDPAIGRLARILATGNDRDAMRAIENVLDRTGYPRKTEVDVDTAREILTERLIDLRDKGDGTYGS